MSLDQDLELRACAQKKIQSALQPIGENAQSLVKLRHEI